MHARGICKVSTRFPHGCCHSEYAWLFGRYRSFKYQLTEIDIGDGFLLVFFVKIEWKIY